MKQNKRLNKGLIAAFVATTVMAGCAEPEHEMLAVGSVDQCISQGFPAAECQKNWSDAQAMHQSVAPKFASQSDCAAQFGEENCQVSHVKAADGSDMFVPMMMGMMMGHMMGQATGAAMASQVATQPLYREKDRRTSGGYAATFTSANGHSIASGKGTISLSKGAAPAPTRTAVARGGFGGAGRGSAAG